MKPPESPSPSSGIHAADHPRHNSDDNTSGSSADNARERTGVRPAAAPAQRQPQQQQQQPTQPQPQPVQHVVLDIEGTTCPVDFVSGLLFPYAAAHLGGFLEEHGAEPSVRQLVMQVEQAWLEDPDPQAQALYSGREGDTVLPYLQWLIRQDRKLTPLKELQGLVWEQGYASGELLGPLYEDVAPALHRWRQAGLVLSVYSSGSVRAQQLIYGHSTAGDLRSLFQHWFDTRVGSKLETASYRRITEQLQSDAPAVLFISDSPGELEAAASVGWQVLLSQRDGDSPPAEEIPFPTIRSFDGLDPATRPGRAAPNNS